MSEPRSRQIIKQASVKLGGMFSSLGTGLDLLFAFDGVIEGTLLDDFGGMPFYTHASDI